MDDVGIMNNLAFKQNMTNQLIRRIVKLMEDMIKSLPRNFRFFMMKARIIRLPSKVKLQANIP